MFTFFCSQAVELLFSALVFQLPGCQ